MAGLVSYASSDEEDVVEGATHMSTVAKAVEEDKTTKGPAVKAAAIKHAEDGPSRTASKPESQSEVAPMVGPVRPTSMPAGPSLPPLEDDLPLPEPEDDGSAPASPYTAQRTMIHNITLPSVANLDIPPSPPGSPPLGPSKKFQQFLDLKKKGVHFNSKLESSSALKNPSLTDKLMAFVELEGLDQYDTTLPTDLWDPSAFPAWAYKEPLKKSREKIAKAREAETSSGGRTSVDFVSAKTTTAQTSSTASASGLSRGEKRKGGWQ